MLLCRKESRDRQTGWRVHCDCEEPGLRTESGTPAEDPKCLQQVQRVQWWQSPARNADVWNGQSKPVGIWFTCHICVFPVTVIGVLYSQRVGEGILKFHVLDLNLFPYC